ncbi:DUF885 domain-containing protein [Cognatilysobacter bugurensis]|uniref:DUF885 domain-containing protein n=1 Tax=Cognatilysobacter bugurensis TaxID=543356 RepID=A0A918W622_9GAMM|nr:DUF885 domain-containing protein [Lysobacter bugurensis]GHA72441.1 hypothetical protein GCM10007067_06170 [Lysobacter bugurensis]
MATRPRFHPLSLHLSAALAVALLGACASTPTAPAASTQAVDRGAPAAQSVSAFFTEFTDRWMRRNPNAATASRYFEGDLQNRLDREITPQTDAYERETVAVAREGLARLATFDRSAMSDTERVSADLMRWQLQTIVDGERYSDTQYPLNQFGGANVGLPNLMTVIHPVSSAQDADNYLARLELFDERMGEAVAESRAQAAKGVLPPRFILQATIDQMRTFIAPAPAKNPLVTTLADKLASVEGVDAAARQQRVEQAKRIVEQTVYPAWRAAIAELESQLPKSTDDAGLWRFANGAETYEHRLRQFTSTQLTADEIHELGLREVARIENEMDAILRKLGRTQGSVKDRADQLERDLAYPDNDAGRKQLMADIDTMIRDAETRADALFDLRPKTPVIARPYPEYRWASAAASYTAPPLDGSRPGVYQMPLRKDRLTRFGLRTLVYHETVPGHHFQGALAVENEALPKFRQVRALGGISAFSEGWALYAERLAAENGWYEGDLEGRLGQLDAELFRARRLVVDTGLHAKRWTRQQAIDYGIPPSEVDRYVVMPGQATSYKIGQIEIIRLRDKARAALGERFNPREFHNLLLLTGTVPLTLLESEVDAWIAKQRAQG